MQKMLAQSAVLHETNIRTSNFTTLNYQYTGISDPVDKLVFYLVHILGPADGLWEAYVLSCSYIMTR